MRKFLLVLLGCVLSIIVLAQGNAGDNPKNSIKDTMVIDGVKKGIIQPDFAFSDTLKKTQKLSGFHKKHRLVAALLAFPLGVFGLHRIYLHTSPLVPLVYIATFGGLFGVLPFIDFVLILLNKDIHLNYTSNQHLFMWQKREKINP